MTCKKNKNLLCKNVNSYSQFSTTQCPPTSILPLSHPIVPNSEGGLQCFICKGESILRLIWDLNWFARIMFLKWPGISLLVKILPNSNLFFVLFPLEDGGCGKDSSAWTNLWRILSERDPSWVEFRCENWNICLSHPDYPQVVMTAKQDFRCLELVCCGPSKHYSLWKECVIWSFCI